jgi:hypothetical protein
MAERSTSEMIIANLASAESQPDAAQILSDREDCVFPPSHISTLWLPRSRHFLLPRNLVSCSAE